MAEKLVGQNYTTPDLVAKVTGKSKYAEDFRDQIRRGVVLSDELLSHLMPSACSQHRASAR